MAIWLVIGLIDFIQIYSFYLQVFCISAETAGDGVSGHYIGLGYSNDIKANFMPENELKGVTEYSYYIFGIELRSGISN